MVKQIKVVAGLLAVYCLASCSNGDQSFEERRQASITFNNENYVSSKSQVRSQIGVDVDAALTAIGSNNIPKPEVASAVLGQLNNGSYEVFITWIQNHPTADAFEFQYNREKPTVVIAISEAQLNYIKSATSTIAYGTQYLWDDTEALWKSLDGITATNDLKIRMLSNKTL